MGKGQYDLGACRRGTKHFVSGEKLNQKTSMENIANQVER
jgi:hypothetical protein